MKNIKKLKHWSLKDVLIEKYRLRDFEAVALADFLSKMLKWESKDRDTAQDMLNHHWLKMIPNYNTKMSKQECREYKKANNYSVSSSRDSDVKISEGGISENNQKVVLEKKDEEEVKEGQKL